MFNICIYVQYTHILFLYIYIQTLLFKSGSKDPTRPVLLRSCHGGGCKVLRGTAGCVAWVLPIKNPR